VEEKVKLSMLCQIYGKMLTKKQYEIINDYCNNDLSLSEIAENNSITRQAVRDIIMKGEKKLFELEEKLAFMTDIEGVCKDPKDPETLISVLTTDEAKQLIEDGTIGGGMIPKIRNCVEAVEEGVSRVHILDGRRQHCLLLEFFTKKGIGTAIIDNHTTLYPHEQD